MPRKYLRPLFIWHFQTLLLQSKIICISSGGTVVAAMKCRPCHLQRFSKKDNKFMKWFPHRKKTRIELNFRAKNRISLQKKELEETFSMVTFSPIPVVAGWSGVVPTLALFWPTVKMITDDIVLPFFIYVTFIKLVIVDIIIALVILIKSLA